MEFYYYDASARLEIAEGSRTTTIILPKGIDPVEVAYLVHSDALKEIVTQLTGRESR